MPRYAAPSVSFGNAFGRSIPDFGILILSILLTFAGSFMAFLRYDMR
jgi:hypothetical protein